MERKLWNILLLTTFIQGIRIVNSFPNLEIQRLRKDSSERMPLYVPGRCGENELLYPVEDNDEWICDCGPGFIYHSEKDTCFAAYRQGPCSVGQHLILKSPQNVPECVQNPCQDGFARYEEKCYELGTPNGPCLPILQGGGIFDVNVSTLRAECLKGTDPLSLFSLPSRCTPGSRRDRNGNCRVIYD